MADTLNVEAGATATVPLLHKSKYGIHSAPVSGAEVASENPAVATVVLDADNAGAKVVGVAPGSVNVTITRNGKTDIMPVVVAAPVADTVEFEPGAATFAPTAA